MLDGWPDGHLHAGKQAPDRGGHDVRGRMPEQGKSLGRLGENWFRDAALGRGRVQVKDRVAAAAGQGLLELLA